MNNKKFINLLKEEDISFEEKDGKIILNNRGEVDLGSLTSLPEGIQFNNSGDVYLVYLTSLPEGIQFNNSGYVHLYALTSLPDMKHFNNKGKILLSKNLHKSPEKIVFI